MEERLPGFVGREQELASLKRWLGNAARTGTGKAIAVRGRRAVGKSTLIEELLVQERPPHAFFAAAKDQPSAEALTAFLGELQRSTLPVAEELAAGVRPDSWEAALRLIATSCTAAQRSGTPTPACLVIDEFPWLSEQEPSIEGLLQNAWDRRLEGLPFMLVLIGSDLHMMEALERYDRPLYGRLQPLKIEPLSPADTAGMIGADATTAFDAYCILGGFPQLARTWRRGDTPHRYLKRELSDPVSPLVVTGERVMAAELPIGSTARAVAAAIGTGETEFTKILNRAGVGRTSVSAALTTLAQKRIVARRTPLTRGHDAKLARYTVVDPYLRFWLRFVAPNLPLIERRRGDLATERIMEAWSTFRGRAIEPIVRASIERMLPDKRFSNAGFVSTYWTRNNDPEVDLVGHNDERRPTSVAFIGSIKWKETTPFSRDDAAQLAAVLHKVPFTSDTTLLVGVSRSGFAADAKLDIMLGPEELLGAWMS